LKVSIPGVVGVPVKVIVVHGELREMIQDVSGRWGMGLGIGFDLTSQCPRGFRMALMTSRSSMTLMIRLLP